MDIPDQLHCLFSATVEERDGTYVIEVPEQEIRLDGVQDCETYRVAVLPSPVTNEADDTDADPHPEQSPQTPPVEEGEQRTIEIESIGDQGDGIARVERRFVVSTPDTEQGERVTHPICVGCAIQVEPDPDERDHFACDGCVLVADAPAASPAFHAGFQRDLRSRPAHTVPGRDTGSSRVRRRRRSPVRYR